MRWNHLGGGGDQGRLLLQEQFHHIRLIRLGGKVDLEKVKIVFDRSGNKYVTKTPMMSAKCTECSTVGEGAMICFSPSVCLPISRDSATLSSTPFFAHIQKKWWGSKEIATFSIDKSVHRNIPLHISVTRPQG